MPPLVIADRSVGAGVAVPGTGVGGAVVVTDFELDFEVVFDELFDVLAGGGVEDEGAEDAAVAPPGDSSCFTSARICATSTMLMSSPVGALPKALTGNV